MRRKVQLYEANVSRRVFFVVNRMLTVREEKDLNIRTQRLGGGGGVLANVLDYTVHSTMFFFPFCAIHYIVGNFSSCFQQERWVKL